MGESDPEGSKRPQEAKGPGTHLRRGLDGLEGRDREISNRLGWLDPLPRAATKLAEIDGFVRGVRGDGLSRILLLGMGGSSLAAEVFGRSFRTRKGFPALDILDTTSPDAVGRTGRTFDPAKTLFIVSSKSGTTVETISLFNYFYTLTRKKLGAVRAGSRFAAITDPGTPLESLAGRLGFRHIFSGDPTVGGRFSALTVFGLVPAALKGIESAESWPEAKGPSSHAGPETRR